MDQQYDELRCLLFLQLVPDNRLYWFLVPKMQIPLREWNLDVLCSETLDELVVELVNHDTPVCRAPGPTQQFQVVCRLYR